MSACRNMHAQHAVNLKKCVLQFVTELIGFGQNKSIISMYNGQCLIFNWLLIISKY